MTDESLTIEQRYSRLQNDLTELYQRLAHWAYDLPIDITPTLLALDYLSSAKYFMESQSFEQIGNPVGKNPTENLTAAASHNWGPGVNAVDGYDATDVS